MDEVQFNVPIAKDAEFHVKFLTKYIRKLYEKHQYSKDPPHHCICSEHPCKIMELLKALWITRKEDLILFLKRMEKYAE